MSEKFHKIAVAVACAVASPYAFMLAAAIIFVWALTGLVVGFSDTWQLVINTGTTIVTFLMVFLIQSSQNRDTESIQLKLDELIRVTAASNKLIDAEHLTDEERTALKEDMERIK